MKYTTIAGVSITEPDDDMVAVSCLREGHFEPTSLEYWVNALAEGGTVLDIGAYTGLYCIMAGLLDCKAVAYEPNPVVYERLLQNIKFNEVEDMVTSFNEAVGKKDKMIELWVKTGTRLTSASTLVFTEGYDKQIVPLRKPKLIKDLVAVKCDVEGYELTALQAIEENLRLCMPLVIAECLDDDHVREVTEFMTSLGYPKPLFADDRNLIFLADH